MEDSSTTKKQKANNDWMKKNSYTIVCECGKSVRKYYISRHRHSKYHKVNIRPQQEHLNDMLNRIEDLEKRVEGIEYKNNHIKL